MPLIYKGIRSEIGCGGRIRTYDLQVMSLTSYQAAPPRGGVGKGTHLLVRRKNYSLQLPDLLGELGLQAGFCLSGCFSKAPHIGVALRRAASECPLRLE